MLKTRTVPTFLITMTTDLMHYITLSDCVGSETKLAEVFTKDKEKQLREAGVLGIGSLKALLRAVFLLNLPKRW